MLPAETAEADMLLKCFGRLCYGSASSALLLLICCKGTSLAGCQRRDMEKRL